MLTRNGSCVIENREDQRRKQRQPPTPRGGERISDLAFGRGPDRGVGGNVHEPAI